jgi:flagellar basal-body rod modification protein FlgD
MSISSVDAINTMNSTASSTADATSTAVQQTSDQFMTILLAQLKNQDPMEPMKDSDMMTQMTQLNSLQELQSIKAQMDQLTSSNSASYAASLIGKNVKAVLDDGTKVDGTVDGTDMSQGLYLLSVNGTDIPLSSIVSVTAAPTAAAASAAPSSQTQTAANPVAGASAA